MDFFSTFCPILREKSKISLSSHFSTFFAKPTHKTHKITSSEDSMRKFLRPKFWSQGTILGYPRPISEQDVQLGACRVWFLVPWGPYEDPILVASQGNPKNPNTTGSWCVIEACDPNSLYSTKIYHRIGHVKRYPLYCPCHI